LLISTTAVLIRRPAVDPAKLLPQLADRAIKSGVADSFATVKRILELPGR
jgi:hypothetical protein